MTIMKIVSLGVRYNLLQGRSIIHSIRHLCSSKFSWPMQSVVIDCQQETHVKRPEGCSFNVSFVDTGRKPGYPTALLLHDNPGTCLPMSGLMQVLDEKGIRIIAPNMPGSGLTKGVNPGDNTSFTYSTTEKGDLVERLLDRIEAYRLDSVIGVGAGCYTAILLATLLSTRFHSVCLVDFPGVNNDSTMGGMDVKQARVVADLFNLNSLTRWMARRMVRMKAASLLAQMGGEVDLAAYAIISHANSDREMIGQQCVILGMPDSPPVTLVDTLCDRGSGRQESLRELIGIRTKDCLQWNVDHGTSDMTLPKGKLCAVQLNGGAPSLSHSDDPVVKCIAEIICDRVYLVCPRTPVKLNSVSSSIGDSSSGNSHHLLRQKV